MFDDVLVSPDSKEPFSIERKYGASVLPKLSKRSTNTGAPPDVVLHAFSSCESKAKGATSEMRLQPTFLFRTAKMIRREAELHLQIGNLQVFSVCTGKEYTALCFMIVGEGCPRKFGGDSSHLARHKGLSPAYEFNGSVHLVIVGVLGNGLSFFCARMRAVVVTQPEEYIDIDDAWVCQLAECGAAGLVANGEKVWHRD